MPLIATRCVMPLRLKMRQSDARPPPCASPRAPAAAPAQWRCPAMPKARHPSNEAAPAPCPPRANPGQTSALRRPALPDSARHADAATPAPCARPGRAAVGAVPASFRALRLAAPATSPGCATECRAARVPPIQPQSADVVRLRPAAQLRARSSATPDPDGGPPRRHPAGVGPEGWR
ncbi:hypothetical protein G6F57_017671 [Rhizopus arrhizus]|nr:hypothetical protein G6F57_017671 [Rhizopus arrhizus]